MPVQLFLMESSIQKHIWCAICVSMCYQRDRLRHLKMQPHIIEFRHIIRLHLKHLDISAYQKSERGNRDYKQIGEHFWEQGIHLGQYFATLTCAIATALGSFKAQRRLRSHLALILRPIKLQTLWDFSKFPQGPSYTSIAKNPWARRYQQKGTLKLEEKWFNKRWIKFAER